MTSAGRSGNSDELLKLPSDLPDGLCMEADSPDRRLGFRHTDARFGLGWRVGRVDDRRARRKHPSTLPPEYGQLLDVSVAGARVRAPSTQELRVGSRTTVAVRGVAGTVVIRRIEPSDDPGQSVYGIEFTEPNSMLTAMIYDTFLDEQATPVESWRGDSRPKAGDPSKDPIRDRAETVGSKRTR